LVVFLLLLSVLPHSAVASTNGFPIRHTIVIVEENHTFDNYFGTYPGANGISGSPPLPIVAGGPPAARPYLVAGSTSGGDLCNSADCARAAYDSGKMDGFVIAERSNLTMGYFDYHQIPYYWDYASQFVLMDNFYTSAMAPSLPNHLYLVAGQSGGLLGDSRFGVLNFTSSTVASNTFYFKSMADELEAAHISWKYYAGGYSYLNNWNPLPAFASFRGNATMTKGLADSSQFFKDLANNVLPSVSWIMPETDQSSEHPPYDITVGERDVVSIVNAVMASPYWNSTAIFITWDDWGGWYDHVPPPQVDSLGYGFRVPCLIISPYAKPGFIDHTQSDFTSTLKFIETVYSLPPLASRDALANNLMEAFDFSQAPSRPLVLPGPFTAEHYPLTYTNGTLYKRVASTTAVVTTTRTSTVTSTLSAPTITSTVTSTSTVPATANSLPNIWVISAILALSVAVLLAAILASRRGRSRPYAAA
jgi:phospholipase C